MLSLKFTLNVNFGDINYITRYKNEMNYMYIIIHKYIYYKFGPLIIITGYKLRRVI